MNFFLVISIFYRNLVVLVLSEDLNRVYCIGFILGFFMGAQIVSGVLLSFMYQASFNIA